MSHSKSALKNMTKEDLINVFMEEHGGVAQDTDTKQDLIDKILAAQEDAGDVVPDDTITGDTANNPTADEDKQPPENDPAAEDDYEAVLAKAIKESQRRVWVKIANDDGVGGTDKVYLAAGDENALVEREVWVHLKMIHVDVLRNCVEVRYKGDGKGNTIEYKQRRFKFEIRDQPNKPADDLEQ